MAAEVVTRNLGARTHSFVTMEPGVARDEKLGLKPDAIKTRLLRSQNADRSSCDSLRSSGVLIA